MPATITGRMMALPLPDIDTDQLLPKQFLTRLAATGWGEFLFHGRRDEPDFALNDPRYAGTTILVAGPNFGCGSSREQAAWAIRDYGFQAVIAPSFGSVFQSNCIRSGVLAATCTSEEWQELIRVADADPLTEVVIDLVAARLCLPSHQAVALDLPAVARRVLLEGLDDISYTERELPAVRAYEASRPVWLPRVPSGDGLNPSSEAAAVPLGRAAGSDSAGDQSNSRPTSEGSDRASDPPNTGELA